MAITIQANDFVKFRWYATLGNQASVITHYYQVPGPSLVGSWSPSFLLNQWLTAIAPSAKAAMAVLAHFDGGSIQIVTVKPYSALLYANQGAGNGTMSSNPAPTQVCGMISRRTDFAGPRYRGRIYMPFMSVTGIDTNGLPSITYQTLLQNFTTASEPPAGLTFTGSGLSILLDPIVFTRKPGASPAPITGHEFPLKFGTQHRRGSYGKPNFSPPMTAPV